MFAVSSANVKPYLESTCLVYPMFPVNQNQLHSTEILFFCSRMQAYPIEGKGEGDLQAVRAIHNQRQPRNYCYFSSRIEV